VNAKHDSINSYGGRIPYQDHLHQDPSVSKDGLENESSVTLINNHNESIDYYREKATKTSLNFSGLNHK